MSEWTAAEIGDQQGRVFVVTGANSGIGEIAARALAQAGAHVILACRDTAKGERVAREIGDNAQVRRLDLADLASIRAFAAGVETVDVLVNNAGVMALPPRRTVDGFEMQIGTNHFGHFALTGLLLDKVTDRVVTMSSGMHKLGSIDLDDANWDSRRYSRWGAYGQSKLANLLFTYELQRRLAASGSTVKSVAAHPGYASTNLHTHSASIQAPLMNLGARFIAQPAEMGALPLLYAATVPDLAGGSYVVPNGFQELRGYPHLGTSNAKSRDEGVAGKLWTLSEKLTGVDFSFAT